MARIAGRTPEQTRRKALDAAATVFRERGVAATLDDVANAAGLSKGGLLYHFSGKDDLLRALITDLADSWRAAVSDAIDPSDQAAGRLTRAYIRASLNGENAHELREGMALAMQLTANPDLAAELTADMHRWEADLVADGLPPAILHTVIAAADGASATALWGAPVDLENNAALATVLTAMTYAAEPIDRIIADTAQRTDD